MKLLKLTFFSLVLLLSVPNRAAAQHEIKTNFLGVLFTDYNLQYEYVTEYMGFQLGISYFTPGSLIAVDNLYTAIRITPEFRYYLNPDDDASGFYAGAYLRYRAATGEDWYTDAVFDENGNYVGDQTYDLKVSGLALGFAGGHKWVTRSGLIFETSLGLGRYLFNNNSFDPDLDDPETEEVINTLPAFDFRIGFTVGYRFGG